MSETQAQIATRRRARRLRRTNFPTPPRDRLVSIMQTGLLPLGHESAVEFLNAEHPKLNRPPFDLETEEGTDRSNAETDIIDGAAQALVRDA